MQPFIVDIGGTIMSLKERAAALKTDIPAVFLALNAKEILWKKSAKRATSFMDVQTILNAILFRGISQLINIAQIVMEFCIKKKQKLL